MVLCYSTNDLVIDIITVILWIVIVVFVINLIRRIKKYKRQNIERTERTKELEKLMNVMQNKLNNYQKHDSLIDKNISIKELDEKINQFESQKENLIDDIGKLNLELENLQSEISDFNDQQSDLEQVIDILNTDIIEYEERLKKLKNEIKINEKQKTGLTKEQNKLNKQLKQLKKDIESHKNELSKSKIDDTGEAIDIEYINNEIDEIVEQYSDFISDMENAEDECLNNDPINDDLIYEPRIDNENDLIIDDLLTRVLRIEYIPTSFYDQTVPYKYPIVKMPKPNSIIKPSYEGRSGRKGYTESYFKKYLSKYFGNDFNIYDNQHIIVSGIHNPYEPDFVLKRIGKLRNIFIDIEIDEPYEGINDIANRKPMHYNSIDDYRDTALVKRGWIIIRFAEIQVFKNPLESCLFIAEVIQKIMPNFKIHAELLIESRINQIDQWTKEQAQVWSEQKYREEYLEIDRFGTIPETEDFYDIQETEIGSEIENQILETESDLKSTQGNKVALNEREDIVDDSNSNSTQIKSKEDIITNAINNEYYISFIHEANFIVKPVSINENLLAFCYIKNEEIEFEIESVTNPEMKETPFIIEENGPEIELDRIRVIVDSAIDDNRYLRINYTKPERKESWVDEVTGEVVEELIESEENIRTISQVQYSIDVLDPAHFEAYKLDENYITGYCHLREDLRTFKLSRISQIAILDI